MVFPEIALPVLHPQAIHPIQIAIVLTRVILARPVEHHINDNVGVDCTLMYVVHQVGNILEQVVIAIGIEQHKRWLFAIVEQ